MIQGDSEEYNLITKHIKKIKIDRATLTCEIGLREGLGTKTIMDAVRLQEPRLYKHIAVDPYGNLAYQHYDNPDNIIAAGYDSEMMQRTVTELYKNYPEFNFFHMTDDYYFKTMGEGHQFVFEKQLMIFGLYKVVHLDGPHTTKDVLNELVFFIPRMEIDSLIIIDDYQLISLGIVDMLLRTYNFKVAEKGDSKIIYKKEI
jgi:hypothetical protein|tara:strand:- start:476 stop:1078 length:603 start_codon:yes stop_codon:yes gene_type:complete